VGGQTSIDTAIIDARGAEPGAAFSCIAAEYVNEVDHHRPRITRWHLVNDVWAATSVVPLLEAVDDPWRAFHG
jgi:hypothetical protein